MHTHALSKYRLTIIKLSSIYKSKAIGITTAAGTNLTTMNISNIFLQLCTPVAGFKFSVVLVVRPRVLYSCFAHTQSSLFQISKQIN